MNRLVQLFEATVSQDEANDGVNSFVHFETLLEATPDVDRAAGFMLLGMALQQKESMRKMALMAFKRTLLMIDEKIQKAGGRKSVLLQHKWEMCVVHQEVGKLLLMMDNCENEAEKQLAELIETTPEEAVPVDGDFKIFDNEFQFRYTREEFLGQNHKMLAKLYHNQGRANESKMHYEISVNLLTDGGTRIPTGNNVIPKSIEKQIIAAKNKDKIDWDSMENINIVKMDECFSWDSSANNGTCTAYVKMPEGVKKSEHIKCTCPDNTTIYIRARPGKDSKNEYRMILSPLRHEISIMDNVFKFNEKKRKYTIIMWARDKKNKRWGADLLSSMGNSKHNHLLRNPTKNKKSEPMPDLFNFDSRINELPKPSDNPTDNLPSSVAQNIIPKETKKTESAASTKSVSTNSTKPYKPPPRNGPIPKIEDVTEEEEAREAAEKAEKERLDKEKLDKQRAEIAARVDKARIEMAKKAALQAETEKKSKISESSTKSNSNCNSKKSTTATDNNISANNTSTLTKQDSSTKKSSEINSKPPQQTNNKSQIPKSESLSENVVQKSVSSTNVPLSTNPTPKSNLSTNPNCITYSLSSTSAVVYPPKWADNIEIKTMSKKVGTDAADAGSSSGSADSTTSIEITGILGMGKDIDKKNFSHVEIDIAPNCIRMTFESGPTVTNSNTSGSGSVSAKYQGPTVYELRDLPVGIDIDATAAKLSKKKGKLEVILN